MITLKGAWIEAHGTGFRACWRDASGKRKRGPIRPNREAAQSWAVENGHAESKPHSIAALADRYVASKLADKSIRPQYAAKVPGIIIRVCRRNDWTTTSDITLSGINAWKVGSGGKGVDRDLAVMLAVLRWANHTEDVPVDAKVLSYRRPRQARKVVAPILLSEAHIDAVLTAAAGFSLGVLATVHYLATYGARPATACKLTIGQVNFTDGTLTVDAKRSGQWQHALLDTTLNLFAAVAHGRGADEPLLLNWDMKPWALNRHGEAAQLAAWYWRNLGKPFLPAELSRIYHLKRAAITRMLTLGMDARTVATFTGHLEVSQVLAYARSNETTSRRALTMLPNLGSPVPQVIG